MRDRSVSKGSIIWLLALALALSVGIVALVTNEEVFAFDQVPTNISSMRVMKLIEVVNASDQPQAKTWGRRDGCSFNSIQKIDFVIGQGVADDIEGPICLTRKIEHPAFDSSPFGFGRHAVGVSGFENRFDSLGRCDTNQDRVQHQVQRGRSTGIIEYDLGLHRDTMRQGALDRYCTNANPWTISGGHRLTGETVRFAGLVGIEAQDDQTDNFENESGTITFEAKVFEYYVKPALRLTEELTCAIFSVFFVAFGWSLLQFRPPRDWSNRLRNATLFAGIAFLFVGQWLLWRVLDFL